MTTAKHRKPRLDLELRPLRGQGCDVQQVMFRGMACGGYLVRRDANGTATSGAGAWWVGIDASPEHGPYRTLTSARKAVVTDQVLTDVLHERGFRS